MSTKKKETQADPTEPTPTPATKRTRGPRKPKVTQPSWYRANFSDGTYRIIEADDELAVYALIATVSAATPLDFAQAGKEGIPLESKPLSGVAHDPAES